MEAGAVRVDLATRTSNFFHMQEMIRTQAKKMSQTPTQFVDSYLSKSKRK